MIKRFVFYNLAGVAGTGLYMFLMFLLVRFFGMSAVAGASISYVFLILFTYAANARFVFKDRKNAYPALIRFAAVSVIGFLLNAGIMYLTVNVLGWWYASSLLIAVAVVPAVNFLLHNYWSFKDGRMLS